MVASFGFGVTLFSCRTSRRHFRRSPTIGPTRSSPCFYGARHAAAGLEDTAIIFAPSRLYFAAPKGRNLDLLAAIDRHLVAYKRDSASVYYHSLRAWTTDEVGPSAPRWLPVAALATLALLAAAAPG